MSGLFRHPIRWLLHDHYTRAEIEAAATLTMINVIRVARACSVAGCRNVIHEGTALLEFSGSAAAMTTEAGHQSMRSASSSSGSGARSAASNSSRSPARARSGAFSLGRR
jgi:hypothetical protein